MKNKIYNVVCIIVSIAFLLIMAGLFVSSIIVAFWSATTALISGYGIISAIVSTFPYLLFCVIPALFFYGCFSAFRNFLKTL